MSTKMTAVVKRLFRALFLESVVVVLPPHISMSYTSISMHAGGVGWIVFTHLYKYVLCTQKYLRAHAHVKVSHLGFTVAYTRHSINPKNTRTLPGDRNLWILLFIGSKALVSLTLVYNILLWETMSWRLSSNAISVHHILIHGRFNATIGE